MTRTLLLSLDVDPGEDLNLLSESVHDLLEQGGLPVIEVKPWGGSALPAPPLSIGGFQPPAQTILPPVSSTGNPN